MKVLVSIPCLLNGGTEIQTLNLVRALVDLGHDVRTVCYYEHTDEMCRQYERAGSAVVVLQDEPQRQSSVAGTIRYLYKNLKKVVKDFKPDVVHVQYMAPGAIPVLIYKILGVKRIVATIHADADNYSANGLRLIRLTTKHLLTRFVSPTKVVDKNIFDECRVSSAKHLTIHNTLPPYIKTDADIRHRVARIGFVGRLEQIKGAQKVIPMFSRIRKSYPNLQLIIVGDGSLSYEMHKQVADNGICDSVEWVGAVDNHKVFDYYRRIDVLWVPSETEGFGLSVVEAMSQGCCVIASRVGGIPELIEDKQTGLLANNGDSFIELTRQLCENEKQVRTISENAIIESRKYDYTNFRNSIKLLYEEVGRI